MRIHIIQIPPQTAEDILTRFQQHVEFTGTLLMDPVDISLHVPLGITRAQNRHLGFQQLGQSARPLVGRSRVAESRVEQHEAVQVRVKRLEVLRLVHGVEVIHVGGDLHLTTETVLNDPAEGVGRGPLGKRELGIAVGHCFRSDEDKVQQGTREDVRELQPDIARKRGLGARSQDKDSYRRRLQT